MKHPGNTTEFGAERIAELLLAYRRHTSRPSSTSDIWHRIVASPSSRFWVSDRRAAGVISAMLRGASLDHMRPTKREMFREIFRRTLRRINAGDKSPVLHIVREVIEEEAPEFYLTPGTAKTMVYNEIRKKCRSRHIRRSL